MSFKNEGKPKTKNGKTSRQRPNDRRSSIKKNNFLSYSGMGSTAEYLSQTGAFENDSPEKSPRKIQKKKNRPTIKQASSIPLSAFINP